MHKLVSLYCLLAALCAASAASPATQTQPIPTLDTKGDVYKTQGPNDPLIYDDAVGTKKTLVIFCDFPDRPANEETTQQRADKTLGGTAQDGIFQNIFRSNSYGKLELDITLVHGWRTMPNGFRAYDPTTTQGHRDMFVDAFALYPEINFNDYDYTLVLMTAKGNFAFGEREPTAIPHREEKITVGVTQSSKSPYTLAHELAHCMGLPDVYTYTSRVPEGTPQNPLGPWDIMSGPSTGFMGWHRHKLGWLDDNRKTYLTQGTHRLTITPLSADHGLSMIVIPALEQDPNQPSKVYSIEVALPLREHPKRDMPQPAGLLVYSTDATKPTGFNPNVLYPKTDKTHAAYHAGDTFNHNNAPFTMKVIKKNPNGSYEVEITVK